MEPNMLNDDKDLHRVITLLNREQIDYLDKIGKDALFSSGIKLSRTKIISAMVDAFRKAGVGGQGIKTKDEFQEKLLHSLGLDTHQAKKAC
ncbi:MAG: hypothetical protein HYY14_04495 [Candidatus Omnitrophica bacterium]|nr:hypothetical protein [Candidatus Omnitrophota bacterium]